MALKDPTTRWILVATTYKLCYILVLSLLRINRKPHKCLEISLNLLFYFIKDACCGLMTCRVFPSPDALMTFSG